MSMTDSRWLCAGALLLGALANNAFAGDAMWGTVTGVKDGAAVLVDASAPDVPAFYNVRLYGLAALEPGQPLEKEARELITRLAVGKQFYYRHEYRNADGEFVGKLFVLGEGERRELDRVDLGAELVRRGLAGRVPDQRYKPHVKGQPDDLSAAEQTARAALAGIWAAANPVVPPLRPGQLPVRRDGAGPVALIPQPPSELVAGVDRNTSQRSSGENECAMAKNPSNPNQLFALCNVTSGAGQFAARSTDGGLTWIYPDPVDKTITDGDAGQGPAACCDPNLAWDSFGNLFITYLGSASGVETILSTNGGSTFTNLATFAGSVDQPSIAVRTVGANVNLQIVWNQGSSLNYRGALVTGLGAVGAFTTLQTIPSTTSCTFGDIAVKHDGTVVQACQVGFGETATTIRVSIDADGLGAGNFGATASTVATNVGGFDFITPQNSRSVDSEPGLAFDANPSSPHFGRLYLVYSDETVDENNDVETMVRFSDNNGSTWSAPIRVNDDATTRAQFLPKIASDPATGNIAVCWHDCRNSATNTGMREYCSAASNAAGPPVFAANVAVGDGTSTSDGAGIEFGDYAGLALSGNVAHPVWADRSNSTGNNPNGTSNWDVYTDRVSGAPLPVQLRGFSIE